MSQKHSEQYKIIGQAIKKYRKQRGLTQEQLADRVSISITISPRSRHRIVTSRFLWR